MGPPPQRRGLAGVAEMRQRRVASAPVQAGSEFARKVVNGRVFDTLFLLVLVGYALMLAFFDPVNAQLGNAAQSWGNNAISTAETVFTLLFTVEVVFLCAAVGKAAYFSSFWNFCDFAIVALGYYSMIPGTANLSVIRVARLLRPLRTLTRVQSMVVLVNSLVLSAPGLLNVLMLVAYFVGMFAIFGLKMWIGKLHGRCWDVGAADFAEDERFCFMRGADDGAEEAGWQNGCEIGAGQVCNVTQSWNPNRGVTSFDNIFSGMLTVFQLITNENWTYVMDALRDVSSPALVIVYFVVLVVFGSFFLMNYFLAECCFVFSNQLQSQEDAKAGAPAVQQAVEGTGQKADCGVDEQSGAAAGGGGGLRAACAELSEDPPVNPKAVRLDSLVVACIGVNFIILAVDYYEVPPNGMSPWLSTLLQWTNTALAIIFLVEMIIKLIGLGPFGYCSSGYNVVDGFTVTATMYELLSGSNGSYSVLRCLRLLRIARSMKSLQGLENLKALLETTMGSMEAIAGFAGLLLLVVYIYALAGMQLFGGLMAFPCDDCEDCVEETRSISGTDMTVCVPRTNFDTFFWSCITVFNVLTCENWPGILYDGMQSVSCLPSAMDCQTQSDGSSAGAAIYFVSLIVMTNYILVSLFIGTLLDNFAKHFVKMQEQKRRQKVAKAAAKVAEAMMLIARRAKGTRLKRLKKGNERLSLAQLFRDFEAREPEAAGEATATAGTGADAPITQEILDVEMQSYTLIVQTGSKIGAGTDANVYARIHGANGHSSRLTLRNKTIRDPFERGAKETFVVDCPALGDLKTLVVGHDGKGRGAGWHLEDVVVKDDLSGERWMFACNMWLDADQDGQGKGNKEDFKLERELKAEKMGLSAAQAAAAAVDGSVKWWGDLGTENAFGLFSPTSALRKSCISLVRETDDDGNGQLFDRFILVCIIFSSVLLAVETPSDLYDKQMVLFVFDVLLTAIFTFEMVAKMVARGMLFSKQGYLKDAWNQADAVIVGVSILSAVLAGVPKTAAELVKAPAEGNDSLKSIRILRALRAFRPLRTIQRYPRMKALTSALLSSLPGCFIVFGLFVCFLGVFGIVFLHLYKGTMYFCGDGSDGSPVEPAIVTLVECVEKGFVWTRMSRHFDNLPSSMLVLFEVASVEDWPGIMFNCVDATEPGQGLKTNNRPTAALLFVFFIIMGAYLMLNLFIGVVVTAYNEAMSEIAEGTLKRRNIMDGEDDPLLDTAYCHPLRRPFAMMVQYSAFEPLMMLLIVLNVLVMATEYDGMEGSATAEFSKVANVVFTLIFTGECVLKLIAYGPWTMRVGGCCCDPAGPEEVLAPNQNVPGYFQSNWNRFDFFIVVTSMAELLGNSGFNPTLIRLFRIFRLARLLRAARKAKGIITLVNAFINTLPLIMPVGFLLFIFMFVYAVLGVNLFAGVKYQDVLSRHANFKNFPMAMLTLFRLATGENWNGLMHECMILPPDCSGTADKPGDDCGSPLAAPLYFLSYMIICTLVTLNLIIAAILHSFFESNEAQDARAEMDHDKRMKRSEKRSDKYRWAEFSLAAPSQP